RFDRAFTHAGVCAVLRSGVITGVYPISIGSQHMRSNIIPPPHIKCFTEYLRARGYYCTNRSKTDYQFAPPVTAWDRQGKGHDDWRGRREGQPFFSVINLTVCHESQIRHGEKRHAQILKNLSPGQVHDPEKAAKSLPPYLPNTPEARKNWAWYHDNISEMDRQAGQILRKLEEDGLADNTLVVFWSDHGQGMPRGKRWIYDSGTHVPVIMRWPGHLPQDSVREDIVTLLDLTATTLSVAGVTPPDHLHGRILIGEKKQPEPDYIFFHRDRMDEAYELQRGARNRRYRYIRNYEPEKTYAQGIDYMDLMPAMIKWRELNRSGELNPVQSLWFAKPKPIEELYDCAADPHNIKNLASQPEHAGTLAAMRKATEDWQDRVGDLGMVAEPILMERISGFKVKVAQPVIQFDESTGKATGKSASIACSTKGASITYRVKTPSGWSAWKLYSQPVALRAAVSAIEAKACRIGCGSSSVATAGWTP
ncbi:MAG: sulfatase, partial [Planctomycetota bacterium]|nr:sulfatase [Planctomycetota bacterium]